MRLEVGVEISMSVDHPNRARQGAQLVVDLAASLDVAVGNASGGDIEKELPALQATPGALRFAVATKSMARLVSSDRRLRKLWPQKPASGLRYKHRLPFLLLRPLGVSRFGARASPGAANRRIVRAMAFSWPGRACARGASSAHRPGSVLMSGSFRSGRPCGNTRCSPKRPCEEIIPTGSTQLGAPRPKLALEADSVKFATC